MSTNPKPKEGHPPMRWSILRSPRRRGPVSVAPSPAGQPRDIYAETTRALGYDPLSPGDE